MSKWTLTAPTGETLYAETYEIEGMVMLSSKGDNHGQITTAEWLSKVEQACARGFTVTAQ